MGSALFKKGHTTSGTNAQSELELQLSLLESTHPFTTFALSDLFSHFSNLGRKNSITRRTFFELCGDLSIDFTGKHARFVEIISTEDGSTDHFPTRSASDAPPHEATTNRIANAAIPPITFFILFVLG